MTAVVGCAGGEGGCGGCGGEYAYPQSTLPSGVDAVQNGARARITQDALDFLEANLKSILVGALGAQSSDPDTITMVLNEPFEVVNGVTIGEGPNETYPTTILIDASELEQKLEMQLVAAGETVTLGGEQVTVSQDGVLIDADDIPVGLDARLFTEVSFGITATAGCDIDGTNPDYCPGGSECGMLTGLSLGILVYPEIQTGAGCDVPGVECIRIQVDVVHAALGSVGTDSLDISVPPRCNVSNPAPDCSEECSDTVAIVDSDGDTECGIICAIEEFGIDLVVGLVGFIEPLIAGFLDNLLETAIRSALDDLDGAPAQVAGRLDAKSLAPGIVPASSLDLGYAVTPTEDAFSVNCPGPGCPATGPHPTKGMDIALLSGVEAAPDPTGALSIPHPCVDPVLGAAFSSFYGDTQFRAASGVPLTGELDGEPYHLGASLAKDAVNQALFGAYNAGTLCLEISSDGVHVLSGGAFPLSAGTLDLLTEGRLRQLAPPSAPAIITLTPAEPPLVELGPGTDTEGHLRLSWSEVEVSFYVLTFERFARVFAVATDLSIDVNIYNDPEESKLLISILGGPQIGNFDERYNELLPEVSFAEVLQSLLGLALDALLADGLEFDYDIATALSDALGAPIYVDFMGLETVPESAREYLNIYLKLTDMPPTAPRTAGPATFQVAAASGLLEQLPHPSLPSVTVPRATGEVHLVADPGVLPSSWQHGFEAFAVVDFGPAKGPFPVDADGRVVVRDPKLTLVGRHEVTLRVRPRGDDRVLGVPTTTVVEVDPYRPDVALVRDGDALRASGADIGSAPSALLFSWQLDDGAWSPFTALTARPLDQLAGVRRVAVRAMDEAGNVSFPAALDLGRVAGW